MTGKSKIFANILENFNSKNIKYSLLRFDDKVLSNETEIDVLIWPESFKQADLILRQNNFVCWKDRTFLKKRVYASYSDGVLWLLDVHLAFVQDGIIYLDLKKVENRLEIDPNGYKILSKEDQLLHYFFHSLLGKGHIQTKHFATIRKLASNGIDRDYLFNHIEDEKIKKIFHLFLNDLSDFNQITKRTLQFQKTIKERLLKQTFSNRIRFYFKKYLFKMVYRNRGVHFAIMGVDGAGKSSLIDALEHSLVSIKGVKYSIVYMGPWGHSKSPWHKWVLKKQITLPKNINGKKDLLQKLKSHIKGTIYYLSVYFELWYRYLKFVRPGLKKGRIVLSDRYIYDLRYIYKKRVVLEFKLIRYFICRIFPKPDKIIFLYNDPDIIVKRKPQLRAEQVQEYQEYYFKTLDKYKPISIETNNDAATIAGRVLDEIFKALLKNFN